ncbi:MAG: hypothetical protein AAF335_02205 [Bacteroidota bacterium]
MAHLPIRHITLCLMLGASPFSTLASNLSTGDTDLDKYIHRMVNEYYTTIDKAKDYIKSDYKISYSLMKAVDGINFYHDKLGLQFSKDVEIAEGKDKKQIKDYIKRKTLEQLKADEIARVTFKYEKKALLEQAKKDNKIEQSRFDEIARKLSLPKEKDQNKTINKIKESKDKEKLQDEALRKLESIKNDIDEERDKAKIAKDKLNQSCNKTIEEFNKTSIEKLRKEKKEDTIDCLSGNFRLKRTISNGDDLFESIISIYSFILHAAGDKTMKQLMTHLYGANFSDRMGKIHATVTKDNMSKISDESEIEVTFQDENISLSISANILAKELRISQYPLLWTDEELKSIQDALRKDFSSFTSDQQVKDFLSSSQNAKRHLQLMTVIQHLSPEWTIKDFLDKLYAPFLDNQEALAHAETKSLQRFQLLTQVRTKPVEDLPHNDPLEETPSESDPYLPRWAYVSIPIILIGALFAAVSWRKSNSATKEGKKR